MNTLGRTGRHVGGRAVHEAASPESSGRRRWAGPREWVGRKAGRRESRHGERGAVSIEVVVIVPGIVLFIALMTAGWRIWSVRAQVHDAAAAGARAASLAATHDKAVQAARSAIAADLDAVSSHCVDPEVQVDGSAFSLAAGRSGEIGVDVTCWVAFSDLVLAMPGTLEATGHAVSRLDTYKERRP